MQNSLILHRSVIVNAWFLWSKTTRVWRKTRVIYSRIERPARRKPDTSSPDRCEQRECKPFVPPTTNDYLLAPFFSTIKEQLLTLQREFRLAVCATNFSNDFWPAGTEAAVADFGRDVGEGSVNSSRALEITN